MTVVAVRGTLGAPVSVIAFDATVGPKLTTGLPKHCNTLASPGVLDGNRQSVPAVGVNITPPLTGLIDQVVSTCPSSPESPHRDSKAHDDSVRSTPKHRPESALTMYPLDEVDDTGS